MMDSIVRLQQWYLAQCNGSWEHHFGVKIDTLDNPGWSFIVDLHGTRHQDAPLERIEIEKSENDWLHCWKEESRFLGMGGPVNLNDIIEQFLAFVSR